MSDTIDLQTRVEHSRSLEDAERFKALDTLTELGLLIPLSAIETYHGRAGDGKTWWNVDPTFQNGSNDSGNSNVNKRPTLYTSDKPAAQEFAAARKTQLSRRSGSDNVTAEVHEIVSSDSDARILDLTFDATKLSEEDTARYHDALKALTIAPSEGSPLDFEYRGKNKQLAQALATQAMLDGFRHIISKKDIEKVSMEDGINKEVLAQIAGSMNARQYSMSNPVFLAYKLKGNNHDQITDTIPDAAGRQHEVPLNLEWIQRYFRSAHIVGIKQAVTSDTISKSITAVSLFDLEKVNTSAFYDVRNRAISRQLGKLLGFEIASAEEKQHPLVHALINDPHIKPEKIMALARDVPGFEHVFDEDAGNWEGYTLGEHTETALRNFDENFADKLPVELLAPMRLALVTHDIGKAAARKSGQARRQKEYNQAFATKFMYTLAVPDQTRKLITSLIGDGIDLAYKAYIRNQPEDELETYARQQLQDVWGEPDPDNDAITGYKVLSRIMLICDGGAYTSMAVTRSADGSYYRNAPSFNRSFLRPHDPGYRRHKLAKPDDTDRAPNTHRRTDSRLPSRVRVSLGPHKGAKATI